MKHIVDTTEVESGWMALRGHDPNRRMVKATLIIGDERVFTESEVRAMIAAILRETEQVPSVNGGFIDIIFPSNVRGAVKECGIVLDPA